MARKKEIITSDDILGKDAVDPDGSVLGGVTKVHVDRKKMKIVGITIDMGIMKPDLYIGINHVKSFGDDAVLLKKVPAPKFKGIKVLTAEGKVLGKVIDMVIHNSTIKEFTITNRRILGKRLGIKYSEIKEIGDSIILKKGFKHKESEKK
jgi:sporulation protein YlmC with PRC-barrel domain